MQKRFIVQILCLGFCVPFVIGCKKPTETVQTLDAAAVPAAIHDAFQGASSEVQTQVAELEDAAKKQDPAAVGSLVELLHRPDVTQEERAAAMRCLPPLLSAAQRAAAQGDARAAQALNDYMISK